jgi:hypothetical protein
MVRSICALTLCLSAVRTAAAQDMTCNDPTPDQRNWWHWIANTHPDSVNYFSAPQSPPLIVPTNGDGLAGRYEFSLIQTLGGNDRNSGYLVLRPPDEQDQKSNRFLRGHIEGLDSAGVFLHSPVLPSSQDDAHPGVEAFYDESHRLELWVGNPGFESTDSGVNLAVFEIDQEHLSGRWVYGGAVTVVEAGESLGPPQGYFCAVRVAN